VISYARVRDLADGLDRASDVDLDRVVTRIADAVRDAGERGVLQIDLGGDEEIETRRGWTVALADRQSGRGRVDLADVEVITSVETFWRLVEGSYSPVEAFRDGRMRVRGNEALAKRILRHLAGPDGRVGCR
jgi:putative sterol carrier protein